MTAALEFRPAASGNLHVVHDGRRIGELVLWPHTGTWRFIDLTRAHYDAGKTLEAAKAYVRRHVDP